MMVSLPGETWLRLVVWLIIGMVIYFGYGRKHSRVQLARVTTPPGTTAGAQVAQAMTSSTLCHPVAERFL